MLSIVFGIVTLVISSIIAGIINSKLTFTTVQGFSLMYVVPVGAMLIGFCAASGVLLGRKITKAVIKTHTIILVVVLGLMSFFTTTYVDYYLTMRDIDASYKAMESKLTNAQKASYANYKKRVNFMKYLEIIHNKTKITLSTRGRKTTEIDNNVVSAISFWLSAIGGGLGGWFLAQLLIGDRTKDKKAKEYRDLKYFARLKYELYDEIAETIDKSKHLSQDLAKIITEYRDEPSTAKIAHTAIKVLKTRSTGEGQVIIEQCEKTSSNNDTVTDKIEKELDSVGMSELMTAILSVKPKERF